MALVKSVKRETLRKEWRAIAYIFTQIILVMLLVYQLLQVIGMRVFFSERLVKFSLSSSPGDYILLALIVALLASIYRRVKKKQPHLFSAQERLSAFIKEALQEKARKVKEQRALALLLIELMFVLVVVIAAYFFFDPGLELIPWSKAGVFPPLATGLNAIVAIAVLVLFYWLYRYTAWYRKQ